jgi:hypothetical protein
MDEEKEQQQSEQQQQLSQQEVIDNIQENPLTHQFFFEVQEFSLFSSVIH